MRQDNLSLQYRTRQYKTRQSQTKIQDNMRPGFMKQYNVNMISNKNETIRDNTIVDYNMRQYETRNILYIIQDKNNLKIQHEIRQHETIQSQTTI